MNHWLYKTDRAPQDDCKNVFTMRLWEPIPLRQVESKNVFFVFCFFVFLVLCDEVLKVSISRELYQTGCTFKTTEKPIFILMFKTIYIHQGPKEID